MGERDAPWVPAKRSKTVGVFLGGLRTQLEPKQGHENLEERSIGPALGKMILSLSGGRLQGSWEAV